MTCFQVRLITKFGLFSLCLAVLLASAYGDDSLKIIDNPGGGQIVYGPVTGQTSMQGAMGAMLRTVHGHFGERPQVGKFFQAGGSDSVATFFTVTAKNQGGKHIAGMVIVSMPSGSQPVAAVIYDEAQRFGTTANPMLTKLNQEWHPAGTSAGSAQSQPAGAPKATAPAAPLHQVAFPDGSGSIGLPDGWQMTGAAMGSVHAAGPNGEAVHMGVYLPIADPRSPRTQMMMRGGRPLPGLYTVYPSGGDLEKAFLAVAQQLHQKQGTPVPTINVVSRQKGPVTGVATDCVLLTAELDAHDGKGLMKSSILVSALRPIPSGDWAITVNQGNIPMRLADQEWSTLSAIANSWRRNDSVINAQVQAQTQAEINRIHQIGANAKAQADAAHAANDAHNASVYAAWDSQDRHSQNFSNYLLDQTVVQNNYTGEHGTVWNQYADSLVKNDPNRYQYVQTPDFLKGIDY